VATDVSGARCVRETRNASVLTRNRSEVASYKRCVFVTARNVRTVPSVLCGFAFLVLVLFADLEKRIWWKRLRTSMGDKTVTCPKVLCLPPLVLLVGKSKGKGKGKVDRRTDRTG